MQLAEVERFGQIVVSAGIETGDAIVDGVACGKHQHWHGVAGRAQIPTDLESILHRKQDVEDHDVVGNGRGMLHGGRAVTDDIDGVPMFSQPLRNQPCGRPLVLDQENSHYRASPHCARRLHGTQCAPANLNSR
jgi:hypothetical protein